MLKNLKRVRNALLASPVVVVVSATAASAGTTWN